VLPGSPSGDTLRNRVRPSGSTNFVPITPESTGAVVPSAPLQLSWHSQESAERDDMHDGLSTSSYQWFDVCAARVVWLSTEQPSDGQNIEYSRGDSLPLNRGWALAVAPPARGNCARRRGGVEAARDPEGRRLVFPRMTGTGIDVYMRNTTSSSVHTRSRCACDSRSGRLGDSSHHAHELNDGVGHKHARARRVTLHQIAHDRWCALASW
jgi:hypothetical protein